MLKFLIEIDAYLYFLIPVIWLIIVIINHKLYWFYHTEVVTRSGFLPNWEGNILVFFTFYWTKEEGDPNLILRLKKTLNYTSIFLALYLIFCTCIWLYIKNNNPLHLWQGY